MGAFNKTVSGQAGQGAAYIYVKPGSGWATTSAFTAELTSPDGAAYDFFGNSISLAGDGATVAVGAGGKTIGGKVNQGAVYIYTMPGSGWASMSAFAARLTASDGAASDYFSISVSLSGDGATLGMGAHNKTVGSNAGQGAAYVFAKPGGGWASTSVFTAGLTSSDGTAGDNFGTAVSLSGDSSTLAVGAPYKTVSGAVQQGKAYLYQ